LGRRTDDDQTEAEWRCLAGSRLCTYSPLSVDSLSGIYLGFSEKSKKEEAEEEGTKNEEKEGVTDLGEEVIKDGLELKDAECEGSTAMPGRWKRSVYGRRFVSLVRRKVRPPGEAEGQEDASCFRLFRRTLNIADSN
jgi:hypothetical protein